MVSKAHVVLLSSASADFSGITGYRKNALVKMAETLEITGKNRVISSSETLTLGEYMKHVNCPICGSKCIKYGKNKSGTQRWCCSKCNASFTQQIDNSAKQLQIFLNWLFSNQTQKEMPGEGRLFRRKTSEFWNIWPLPPLVAERKDIVYVDGVNVTMEMY